MKITSIQNIPAISYNRTSQRKCSFKSGLSNDRFELQKNKSIDKILTTHNNPVEIFFSDFDGTIRNSLTKKVPLSTKDALLKFQHSNIPFVIASGRCLPELNVVIDILPIKPKFFILGHGCQILDETKKTIFLDALNDKKSKEIINFYYKNKEKYPNVFMALKSPEHINLYKGKEKIPTVSGLNVILLGNPDIKFSEEIREFSTNLINEFNDEDLNIDFSSPLCCEVTPKSVNKFKGASIVADMLGIKMKNAAAIGDADNDIGIIENIQKNNGLGVSMGNSSPKLLEVSNFVTDNIEKDGYSRAIRVILENNKRLGNS